MMKYTQLAEKVFQFGYHDTSFVSVEDNNLSLSIQFDRGLYILNESGKELQLSKPLKMIIKISDFYDQINSNIEVTNLSKKESLIEFEDFKSKIRKNRFLIHNVYYSRFNNSILFDGDIDNQHIIFTVEGCEEIDFLFDY